MNKSDSAAPVTHLTTDDFVASGYLELLADHAEANCFTLHDVFLSAKSGKAGSADRVLELLAEVCSMRLVPEEPTMIYRRMIEWSDGSGSKGLGHLTTSDLDLFAQLAPAVAHTALRGRLADLVWLREPRRGVAFARIAIEAYTSLPITRESWLGETERCWHRALQLAKQIRGEDQLDDIEKKLLAAFFAAGAAVDYEPLGYLKPLRAERRSGGRALEVAEQLADIGTRMFDASRPFEAQAFYEAAAEWFEWARVPKCQADMLAGAARSIGLQAEQGDGAIVQHHWYGKAIAAYRRVRGPYRADLGVEEAVAELRKKLGEAGHRMLGEMGQIRIPGRDLSDDVQSAVDHVKGRRPFPALLAFCGLDTPFERADIEWVAEQNLAGTIFDRLVDSVVVSEDGRVVARRQAGTDQASRIAVEARRICVQDAAETALARILPALDQLKAEHSYGLVDFVNICRGSPIIPADRAEIFGQGLYAGYCRDMVQAMHILMPQFEHVVRHILKNADAETTHHKPDSTDDEVALGALVERAEMELEFGYGLTLAIHALMCDKSGPNLRNEIAHGLAGSDLCDSPYALYAWWLILQLVTETYGAAIADAASADGSAVDQ